jgi:hypothetical protein
MIWTALSKQNFRDVVANKPASLSDHGGQEQATFVRNRASLIKIIS